MLSVTYWSQFWKNRLLLSTFGRSGHSLDSLDKWEQNLSSLIKTQAVKSLGRKMSGKTRTLNHGSTRDVLLLKQTSARALAPALPATEIATRSDDKVPVDTAFVWNAAFFLQVR